MNLKQMMEKIIEQNEVNRVSNEEIKAKQDELKDKLEILERINDNNQPL